MPLEVKNSHCSPHGVHSPSHIVTLKLKLLYLFKLTRAKVQLKQDEVQDVNIFSMVWIVFV